MAETPIESSQISRKRRYQSSGTVSEGNVSLTIYWQGNREEKEGQWRKDFPVCDNGEWIDIDGLKKAICNTFELPPDTNVVLCDTSEREIDDHNLKEFNLSGMRVMAFPENDRTVRNSFKDTVNFTPHPNIFKTGTLNYFAKNRDILPHAMCEFVDNSIDATRKNEERLIDIFVVNDDDKTMVAVWDNGVGMTADDLVDFATFSLDPKTRGLRGGSNRDATDSADNCYINSQISQYGVGSKQAGFYIGSKMIVVSRKRDSKMTSEICLCQDSLNKKYSQGDLVYSTQTNHRAIGNFEQSILAEHGIKSKAIKDLIVKETKYNSCTLVVVVGIEAQSHLDFLENKRTNLIHDIASTYHHYLHGLSDRLGISTSHSPRRRKKSASADNFIKGVLTCTFVDGKETDRHVINHVTDDIESQFIKKAKDRFAFELVCLDKDGSNKHVIVKGDLHYYPLLEQKETKPTRDIIEIVDEDEDEDEDEKQPAAKRQRRSSAGEDDIFRIFWQGRLIPATTVGVLPFMDDIPQDYHRLFRRLAGVLYLNSSWNVTQNKLTVVSDLQRDLGNAAVVLPENNVEKRIEQAINANADEQFNKKQSVAFTKWIKKCHEIHDKQIYFISPTIGDIRWPRNPKKEYFQTIRWAGANGERTRNMREFKKGDLVKINFKTPVYGEVVQFTRFKDTTQDDSTSAVGYVEVVRRPNKIYGFRVHRADDGQDPFLITASYKISKMEKEADQSMIDSEYKLWKKRMLASFPENIGITFYEGEKWDVLASKDIALKQRKTEKDPPLERKAGYMYPPVRIKILGHKDHDGKRESLASVLKPGQNRKSLNICWQVLKHNEEKDDWEILDKHAEREQARKDGLCFRALILETVGLYKILYFVYDLDEQIHFRFLPDVEYLIHLSPGNVTSLKLLHKKLIECNLGEDKEMNLQLQLQDKWNNNCVAELDKGKNKFNQSFIIVKLQNLQKRLQIEKRLFGVQRGVMTWKTLSLVPRKSGGEYIDVFKGESHLDVKIDVQWRGPGAIKPKNVYKDTIQVRIYPGFASSIRIESGTEEKVTNKTFFPELTVQLYDNYGNKTNVVHGTYYGVLKCPNTCCFQQLKAPRRRTKKKTLTDVPSVEASFNKFGEATFKQFPFQFKRPSFKDSKEIEVDMMVTAQNKGAVCALPPITYKCKVEASPDPIVIIVRDDSSEDKTKTSTFRGTVGETIQPYISLLSEAGDMIDLKSDLGDYSIAVSWGDDKLVIPVDGALPPYKIPERVQEPIIQSVSLLHNNLILTVEKFSVDTDYGDPAYCRLLFDGKPVCGVPVGNSIRIELLDMFYNVLDAADHKDLTPTIKIDCEMSGDWRHTEICEKSWTFPRGILCGKAGTQLSATIAAPEVEPEVPLYHFDIIPGEPSHLEFDVNQSGFSKSHRCTFKSREDIVLTIRCCDSGRNVCRRVNCELDLASSDKFLKFKKGIRNDQILKRIKMNNGKASVSTSLICADPLVNTTAHITMKTKKRFTQLPPVKLDIDVIPLKGFVSDISGEIKGSRDVQAGGEYPSFYIHVETEDDLKVSDEIVDNFKVSLEVEGEPDDQKLRDVYAEPNLEDGKMLFEPNGRNVEKAGKYFITVKYEEHRSRLMRFAVSHEDNLEFQVSAGDPVKLNLIDDGLADTLVTCSDNVKERIIAKKISISMLDQYENQVPDIGRFLHQNDLEVKIVQQKYNSERKSPVLAMPIHSYLEKDLVIFKKIQVKEGTGDSDTYSLHFFCTNRLLEPCYHQFMFQNDFSPEAKAEALRISQQKEQYKRKKEEMHRLQHEKSRLMGKKRNAEKAIKDAKHRYERLKDDIDCPDRYRFNSMQQLEAHKYEIHARIAVLEKEISNARGTDFELRGTDEGTWYQHNDVIGIVGALGRFTDQKVATIASWAAKRQMRSFYTTHSHQPITRAIERKSKQYRVYPLDFIPDKNIKLPHMWIHGLKNQDFTDRGNPQLLVDLVIPSGKLQISHVKRRDAVNQIRFRRVFSNVFGSAVVMDSHDHAKTYRREIAKAGRSCPVIYSLDGKIVHSDGGLGGRDSSCPSASELSKTGMFAISPQDLIDKQKSLRDVHQTLIRCQTAFDVIGETEERVNVEQIINELHEKEQTLKVVIEDVHELNRRIPAINRTPNSRKRSSSASSSSAQRPGSRRRVETPVSGRVRTRGRSTRSSARRNAPARQRTRY